MPDEELDLSRAVEELERRRVQLEAARASKVAVDAVAPPGWMARAAQ
jgi:hypothetical protein